MTRQQRRYLERETMKCAEGIARITMKRDIDIVDHNHKEFLSQKAQRIRRLKHEDNGQAS